MNADMDYFGKLYKNKDEWKNYSKREVNKMIAGFTSLRENLNLPIPDERVARRFRVSIEEIYYIRIHGDDILKEMKKLGVSDKKELSRLRKKLKQNAEVILCLRQDGEEPEMIFSTLEIPYEKKLWLELVDYFNEEYNINIESEKDILMLSRLLKRKKDIPASIKDYPLFRNKQDVIDALVRNEFDLEDYLNATDLADYERKVALEKATPNKIHINFETK